jgi:hypothetical protein
MSPGDDRTRVGSAPPAAEPQVEPTTPSDEDDAETDVTSVETGPVEYPGYPHGPVFGMFEQNGVPRPEYAHPRRDVREAATRRITGQRPISPYGARTLQEIGGRPEDLPGFWDISWGAHLQ